MAFSPKFFFCFFLNLTCLKSLNPKFEYNLFLKLALFIAIISLPQCFALNLTKDNQKFCSGVFCNHFNKSKFEPPTEGKKNRFRQQLFF